MSGPDKEADTIIRANTVPGFAGTCELYCSKAIVFHSALELRMQELQVKRTAKLLLVSIDV